MSRYLSIVKQYGWIIPVCAVLAFAVGYFLVKSQPPAYQATSVVIVNAGAPGTTYPGGSTSTDSLGEASNYASEITTRSLMDYIVQFDPQIQKLGYTADYLLSNVVTTPSTTAATVNIALTARHPGDAILLANDVAEGFTKYIQTQNQQALDAHRQDLQNELNTYTKQKQSLEATILTIPTTDPRYVIYTSDRDDIIRQMDALQAQLLVLPPTINGDVSVIQLATTKDVTSASKSTLTLAVTAAIGLLIGMLIVLLMIFVDRRLRSEEQVKEKLGMAYLGSLLKSKALEQNPTHLDDSTAQELTDICVNLRLLGILPAQKGAVLLVTSAQVSEGKTTVVAALAAAMASAGNAVLVIDGNLQRPVTHLAFGISNPKIGLSGLFKSMGNIEDAVQRTNIPGVWLLAGGAPISAPALLLEQKLPALLSHLRKKADVIIIDGPAVLSGSEASIMANIADGAVLVVDGRHSRFPLLLRTREVLSALTHVPMGVIINCFSQHRHNHYYVTALPNKPVIEQVIPAPVYASNGDYSYKERKAELASPLQNGSTHSQTPPFLQPIPTPPRPGVILPSISPRKSE